MLTHSDIGKLYKVFRSIDVDNSGTIEVNELMDGSKMEKNTFQKWKRATEKWENQFRKLVGPLTETGKLCL